MRTVPQMSWAGVQDGEFLRLAAQEFDVFITVDQNLPLQQNLTFLDLAVLVLQARSNRLSDLQSLDPNILKTIPLALKGQSTTILDSII